MPAILRGKRTMFTEDVEESNIKANITKHEITSNTTYHAITVEINDKSIIYKIDIVIVETYSDDMEAIDDPIEYGPIKWIAQIPHNIEKRNEIIYIAKKAVKEYIENF